MDQRVKAGRAWSKNDPLADSKALAHLDKETISFVRFAEAIRRLVVMEAKDWIGVASAVLSITAIAISWTISRLTARASIRPVLVFEYPPHEGWKVKNIGSGPALNVLIAQRENGKWINPVRVPPMSNDASLALTWCLHDNDHGLGALYEDVDGRKYTSTCGNDLSRVFSGHVFGPWGEDKIGKHWAEGKIVPPVSNP